MPSANPSTTVLFDSPTFSDAHLIRVIGPDVDVARISGPAASASTNAAVRREVVFVDPTVPDYQSLVDGLQAAAVGRRFDVYLLDPTKDGLAQVTGVLARYQDVSAVHFLAHGRAGAVRLGDTWVDLSDLKTESADVRQWSAALAPGSDLFFYGCDVAADAAGRELLQTFAGLTGAAVAGSTDATGAAADGGNWTLEYSTGPIDAQAIDVATWQFTLGTNPIANNDSYSATQNTPLITTPQTGVLNNDTDPLGRHMSANLVTGPAHGTLHLNGDGSFNYTGNAAFFGTDSFTYVATDGQGTSNVATVTISVAAAQAPITKNDSYTTTQGSDVNTDGGHGVLANDSDPQSWALTAVLASGPSNGTVTLNADGSFHYTPNSSFSGTDSFTYRATDGINDSSTAKVTITVTAKTVLAVADSYSLNPDTTLSEDHNHGVLANDTLPQGLPANVILVSGTSNGILTLNNDGSFQYAPDADFTGNDSFSYEINDGLSNSNTVTVKLTVNSVIGPITQSDSYTVVAGQQFNVGGGQGVLANDSDPQGRKMTAVLASSPTHGTITFNSDGSFNYTPLAGFVGTDKFTYRANDGLADSSTTQVTLTVVNVPVANNDYFSQKNGGALNVTTGGVLANDYDPSGKTLTAVLVHGPGQGTLTLNANGTFTYTPGSTFIGTDQFQYQAYNGTTYSNTATVFITEGSTGGKLPVAVADAFTLAAASPLQVGALTGVLANDTDPQALQLRAQLVKGPSHGSVRLNDDGSFQYSPNLGYSGTDTFTYQANDGISQSNIVTVTLTILPVFAPTAQGSSYTLNPATTLNVNPQGGVLASASDPQSLNLTAVLDSGPANGTLKLNNDGSFQYTPNASFTGTDSFTFFASNGRLDSSKATVTLTVNAVVAPTAQNDAYTVTQGKNLNVGGGQGILANDTDPQGRPMTAVLVFGPANGSLTLQANGQFQYTPNLPFSGADSFTYRVDDGLASSNIATVTLNVVQVHPPTAANDAYTVNQGTPFHLNGGNGVLHNDTGPGGYPLNPVLLTGPAHGALILNNDGSFTYEPNAGFAGIDTFTYQVYDGLVDSGTATVTLTVIPVLPPVVQNDAYAVALNATLTVGSAGGVLANDTDPQGLPLTSVLVSSPANGVLSFNADGSFTYIPASGFVGIDSFTYEANNSLVDSASATVTITVSAGPVALDDAYAAAENTPLTVGAAAGVLANDTDPNGLPLTVSLVSNPGDGTLTLNADGSFTYTPAAGFSGTDSFTYQDSDGSLTSNVATVTLAVSPNPPIAANDNYTVNQGGTLSVAAAAGVLANDTDPNGLPLTASVVSGTANGTLTFNGDGSFTYTPAAGFYGTDSFTYQASDGSLTSNVVTVTLTVAPGPPVAASDAYATLENTPLSVAAATGVLANDTDPNGLPLTASLVSGPADGTLSFNADGSFTYTPNAGFTGTDSFTYEASDGSLTSNVAIVSLAVAQPPTAADDAYSTSENATLSVVAATGVLANDTDPNGLPLSASLVSGPANGTLTFNGDGSFTYTPAAGFSGNDSFTYQASDGTLTSNVATATLTVALSQPIAADDTYAANQGGTLSVPAAGVLANDADPNGLPLTAAITSPPAHGVVVLNANGSFTYTPAAGFSGTDSFTYRASDGSLTSNVATVTLTVSPPPTAADDAYSTSENSTLSVNAAAGVLANDTDPNGLPLTASLVSGMANGTLTFNGGGSFIYTPTAGFYGTDSFTYQASDGSLTSNVATVTLTVAPSPPVAASDSYATLENTPLTVAATGVLANDTDPNGLPLTASLVSGPADGTLTLNADGSFTYTPAAGFIGTNSFMYSASDGQGGTATGTVTVKVVDPAAFVVTTASDVVDGDTSSIANLIANMGPDGAISLREALLAADNTPNVSGQPVHISFDIPAGPFVISPVSALPTITTPVVIDATTQPGYTGTPIIQLTGAVAGAGVSGLELGTGSSGSTIRGLDISDFDQAGILIDGSDNDVVAGNFLGSDVTGLIAAANGTFGIDVTSGSDTMIGGTSAADRNVIGGNGRGGIGLDGVLVANTKVFGNYIGVGVDGTTALGNGGYGGVWLNNGPTNNVIGGRIPGEANIIADSGGAGVNVWSGTTSIVGNSIYGNSGLGIDLGGDGVTPNHSPPAGTGPNLLENYPVLSSALISGSDLTVGGTLNSLPSATFTLDFYASPAADSSGYGQGKQYLGSAIVTTGANGIDAFGRTFTNVGVPDGWAVSATSTDANGNTSEFGPDVRSDTPPIASAASFTAFENTTLTTSPGLSADASDPDGDPLTFSLALGAAHGSVSINPNGSFHYTPAANYYGPDGFTYLVSDGHGGTATATVSLTVVHVNQPPSFSLVGNPPATAENAGTQTIANFAFNISPGPNEAGQLVNFVVTGNTNSGLFASGPTISPTGVLTYTAAANASGTATITIILHDDGGTANGGQDTSGAQTFVISVTPANLPPTPADDSYSYVPTVLNPSLMVAAPGVLANDTDPNGETLTISTTLVVTPALGTVVMNADGSFTYTALNPLAGGTDTFVYQVTNTSGLSADATVTIQIGQANQPPVAVDDSATIAENTVLNGPSVLTNDSDPNGSGLTAVLVSNPAHGTLTLNPNGTYTYTPAANFTGTDSFTYEAFDGQSDSNVATVTITVTPVYQPPIITSNGGGLTASIAIPEETTFVTTVTAIDPNTPPLTLTYSIVGGADAAHFTIDSASGDLQFASPPNYAAPTDANGDNVYLVTVEVADTAGETDAQALSITVVKVNQPPTAADDAYAANGSLTVGGPGVLANDTDPDGDPLTAVLVAGPAHGGLSLNADGSFTYTPAAGFAGSDSFTYRAFDGSLTSNLATVTITVTPIDNPPTANDDGYRLTANTPIIIPGPGVLVNDVDPENDVLTAILVSGPSHGTLSFNADGSFTYAPNPGFAGADSFSYRATDGTLVSNLATVTLTVVPVPPTASDDNYAVNQGGTLTTTAPGVLSNDADPNGGTLTAVLDSGPSHGTLTFDADGSFTYTPDPAFVGTDSFTYHGDDGLATSAPATVSVVVRQAAAPPSAADDAYGLEEDGTLTLSAANGVLADDAAGTSHAPLMALLVSNPAHGRLSFNSDGSFTYTPDSGFTGEDNFSYRASDGQLTSGVANVTITVTPKAAPTSGPSDGGTPVADIPPSNPSPSGSPDGAPPTGGTSAPPASVPPISIVPSGAGSPTLPSLNSGGGGGGGNVGAGPAAIPPSAPVAPPTTPATPAPAAPTTPRSVVPAVAPPATRQADIVPVSNRAYAVESLSPAMDVLVRDTGGHRTLTYSDIALTTGVATGIGYVVINSRLMAWLLSMVLARPLVWKRLDPLEVLYAWEKEKARRGEAESDDEESLASMVG